MTNIQKLSDKLRELKQLESEVEDLYILAQAELDDDADKADELMTLGRRGYRRLRLMINSRLLR